MGKQATSAPTTPLPQQAPEGSELLSHGVFHRFASFVTDHLGIKMPKEKVLMLSGRISRRIRQLQLASADDYARYLFESIHGPEERVHFIDAVTTNKTDFFREPAHFSFLEDVVLPGLAASAEPGRLLTFWSAACSSGEEPYTLGMLLNEFTRFRPGLDFGILATDVSTRVLAQAVHGIYDASRIEPVPEPLRCRYLLRDSLHKRVRIVPELRSKVSFHRLNLMDDDYRVRTMFDVVFLRNVLIYFERRIQEAVVNKLCRNLKPGGFLFVGHAESLAGFDVPLTQVGHAVFRKTATTAGRRRHR